MLADATKTKRKNTFVNESSGIACDSSGLEYIPYFLKETGESIESEQK